MYTWLLRPALPEAALYKNFPVQELTALVLLVATAGQTPAHSFFN